MKKKLLSIFTVVILTVLGVGSVSAQIAPPPMQMIEAYGFENVLELDDRLILIRYELPLEDSVGPVWQTDTTANQYPTAFMRDASCADADNLKDACYTSLRTGMVLHTMYDGVRGGTGVTQVGIRSAPRIGDGVSAIYIRAGHGLAPVGAPSASYETCLEGSATTFILPTYSSRPIECANPLWIPTTSVLDKDSMVTILVSMMQNVQDDLDWPVNSFVDQSVITETGSIMPKEAFSAIASAAPRAFYAAIQQPWTDVNIVPTPTALDITVETNAQAGRIYQAFDGAGAQYFGTTAQVLGGIGFVAFALVVIMAVGMWTRSITYGSILGMLVLITGMFAGVINVAIVFGLISILLVLGSTYVFRRFPQ